MHRTPLRPSLLFLALAAAYGTHADGAEDSRFYVAPMASYALADDDRHTKDGIGGTLAFGVPMSSSSELELLGTYLKYKGEDDGDSDKLEGGGVGVNFFGSKRSGPYVHADVMASKDWNPVFNVGLGMYAYLSKSIAIRAEALYHNDNFVEFREPLFHLGVRIPIGSVPAAPVLPPRAPEPVAVVPPVTPPPACADNVDNDGDGKVDYPADPGCTAADDPDETDPKPACPPPAPGEPVTLEGCKAGDVIVLRGVNFDFDKSTLTVNAKTILDDVAAALVARSDIGFEIGGHTDAKGSDEYNQKLSERRAKSVLDYLAKKGVDKKRMTSKGYGEAMPVADNETDEGRELNRRVELRVTAGVAGAAPAAAAP
jgi:OOP family OmpA-OmpF porin